MPKVGMKSFGIRQYTDRISKDYFTRLKKLRLKTRVKSNVLISTMLGEKSDHTNQKTLDNQYFM